MLEKLSLVKYSHSRKRQLTQMVYGEHQLEVGTHLATPFSHLYLYLDIYGNTTHSLFKDIWTGVLILSQSKLEYGRNEKLGDNTTTSKTSAFI